MSILASIYAWIPDAKTVYADFINTPSEATDALFYKTSSWKGMTFMDFAPGWAEGGECFFSGSYWSRLAARHWEIPLAFVSLYLVMIPALQWYIARNGKCDVRCFAFYWNALLSFFSCLGVFACVPTLIWSLTNHGLYFTTCAPAQWYGTGICGFFIALFVYSKVAELVDTVLLILAGKAVVTLQWWHHSTVLLYCWHAYVVRIATGAWFASMNYVVHSLMYGYFALMGTRYRKAVAPFAIYITTLQLLQMIVGMFVTIQAVLYQTEGSECHVNRTNSVLGLTMYASYFFLFAKLFIDNYLMKHKQREGEQAFLKRVEKSSEVGREGQFARFTMYASYFVRFAKVFLYSYLIKCDQKHEKAGLGKCGETSSAATRGVHSSCITKGDRSPSLHANAHLRSNGQEQPEMLSTASTQSALSSWTKATDDTTASSIVCLEGASMTSSSRVKRRGGRLQYSELSSL